MNVWYLFESKFKPGMVNLALQICAWKISLYIIIYWDYYDCQTHVSNNIQ